jgi:CRP-like cAMP-binding protein
MAHQQSLHSAGFASLRPPPGHHAPGVDNAFLLRLRLMGGLGESDLAALEVLCGDRRQLRARATAVQQGRPSDRVFVVLDGWACSYRLLADGRRQITQLMVPGDVCNLEALHLTQTGSAVGTLTPCTLTAVSPQALRELAADRRPIADALAWLAAVDMAGLVERNASLGRRSAREHVAHLLCEMLIRLTLIGRAKGNGYVMPLTQEEIADVLGLTSVHVNRVVQGLRRDGMIEYGGKELVITQWSALRAAAGFRADYLHLEGADGSGTDFSAAPWAFGTGGSSQAGFTTG